MPSLVGRQYVRAWCVVFLLTSGCATSGAAARGGGANGQSTGRGYEVREATEETDTSGLEVRLEEGTLSQEAAQEAITRRFKDLTRCYREAGPAMGYADGAVSLRFVVDTRGAASDVRVTESRLGNFAVEQCLISVGRTIAFPRAQGAATANVDYTLEFRSSGDLPVVDLPGGQLDAELPTLFARVAGDCERVGADEVLATVYIDAAGAVRSVGLASRSTLDGEAARCLSSSIQRWTATGAPLHGSSLGRTTVALHDADLATARVPKPVARRARRARR
jgi:hypothetical protein